MKRRISFFLIGLLSSFAWASAIAQTTINGYINGAEYCFQSEPNDLCGGDYAGFAGVFSGTINGNETIAFFDAKVTHQELNYTKPPFVTLVTGGEWSLYNFHTTIKGTVATQGGTLKYHKNNNTFTVDLTGSITEGGTGTVRFDGTLNHNDLPPTITGQFRTTTK